MTNSINPNDFTAMAPDVDRPWRDSFIMELRLLGVPGHRIGDELAVVQSHVAESGDGAVEAFGEPVDYARAIAGSGRDTVTLTGREVIANGLGLLAILLVPAGLSAWLSAESVAVTVGSLVSAVVVVALVVGISLYAEQAVRFLLRRRWQAALLFAALWATWVALLLLLPQRIGTVPAAAVALVGLVALVAASVLSLGTRQDPIVAPGDPGVRRRAGSWLLFPAITALVSLLALGLHLLT